MNLIAFFGVALVLMCATVGVAAIIGGLHTSMHLNDYKKNPRRITDPAGHDLALSCDNPDDTWQHWTLTDTSHGETQVLARVHALKGAGGPNLMMEMERAYLWDQWDMTRRNL